MSFSYLLRLAIKNIIVVNSIRYGLIVLLLVMSIIFGLLGLGFVDGMEYGILRVQQNIISGDIVYQPAHSEDYLEIGDEERQKLNQQFERKSWVPRLQRPMTLHIPSQKRSTAIQVLASPKDENRVFDVDDFTIQGDWKDDTVAIGVGLAQKHEINIGDSVILESQNHSGSITAQKMEIKAIVDAGNFAFHHILWLPYSKVSALIAEGMASSIHIRGTVDCPSEDVFILENWTCTTAKQEAWGMLQINMIRERVFVFILMILWFISISSLFHITWMSVHERRSEIHTLRTLGTPMHDVRKLLMIEGLVVGVISAVVGVLISYVLCDWFFIEGIVLDGLSLSLGEIPLPQVIFVLFDPLRAVFLSLLCIAVTTFMALPSLYWLRHKRGEMC